MTEPQFINIETELQKKESVSILGGGINIPYGTITLIYGNPRAGKTVLASDIGKKVLEKNQNILILDFEKRFLRSPMGEFLEKNNKKDNCYIIQTREGELFLSKEKFKEIVKEKKIKLVIVDSIIKGFGEIEHHKTRAKLIRKNMVLFQDLSRELELIFIVISQIYTHNKDSDVIGGKAILYYSDMILKLRKGRANKRIIEKIGMEEDRELSFDILRSGEIRGGNEGVD